MAKCDCCKKEIKQINTPYVSKIGEILCYRCDRYVQYTEQSDITKDNYLEKYLYMEGKKDILYACPPVDVRKVREPMLGFAGSWWKIELFDGSIHYSNNVWCTINVNNIPEKLQGMIHPNIKSITSHTNYRFEALKALGWDEEIKQNVKGNFDIDPVNLDDLPF